MEKIKICITDDSEMFSAGVRSILEVTEKYDLSLAKSSQELFQLIDGNDANLPVLILLDVKLKNSASLNGIEIARELKTRHPSIKIIILTSYDDKEILKQAIEAGVEGFLPKEAVVGELHEAIETVLNNQNYMGKTIPFHAISYAFNKQSKKIDQLTKTEKTIFFMVCKGETNNEIAEKLTISVHTVETHKSNIKSKLSLKNDIECLRIAIEENLEEILQFYKIQKQ
jgi:DNA-binding NarL/FixJ family response regulator